MNTVTHLLIAETAFQKKSIKNSGIAALIGAVAPDFFIGIFLAVSLFNQQSSEDLWSVQYFQEPWNTIGTISSSIPIWVTLACCTAVFETKQTSKEVKDRTRLVLIFALSGISHILVDFLTHADDAYSHLWPITNWKFHSPFSYWDVEHNARFVRPIEGSITIFSCYLLWPRTNSKYLKTFLVLATLAGIAMILSSLF